MLNFAPAIHLMLVGIQSQRRNCELMNISLSYKMLSLFLLLPLFFFSCAVFDGRDPTDGDVTQPIDTASFELDLGQATTSCDLNATVAHGKLWPSSK
jgi:hypothetical protein